MWVCQSARVSAIMCGGVCGDQCCDIVNETKSHNFLGLTPACRHVVIQEGAKDLGFMQSTSSRFNLVNFAACSI